MNKMLSDVDLDDVEEICNESLWTDICTRKEELFSFFASKLFQTSISQLPVSSPNSNVESKVIHEINMYK
jgi:hypothetical protein